MRIIKGCSPEAIKQAMHDIRVDPYGVDIMWPKAVNYIVKLDRLSNISANILKQEMLSFGAEAALARGALTGKTKNTGCLLMGNLAQFRRLIEKLKSQPFGLEKLSAELEVTLNNYQNTSFTVNAGRHNLNLSSRAYIMGIINVTPDSFSGDGLLGRCNKEAIVEYGQKLAEEGADILDVGGESTRPGAKPVPLKVELERVLPIIKALAKKVKLPISVDTYKPHVAEQALDSGAAILNDIRGLREARMLKIAAKYKAAVIIMHMKGTPLTMQKNTKYISVVDEIIKYLSGAIEKTKNAGINSERIIIDPGLGFGKTAEQNLEILKNLSSFKVLGRPILAGPSRKSFIGKIINADPDNRIFGTVSAVLSVIKNGAKIVRVHDVKAIKQAIKIEEAIENT
ncbi:MAG: dihydropteroate synthase [Candidatus Omnitrophota bacterium]|jgi:dihydropteroate synthase